MARRLFTSKQLHCKINFHDVGGKGLFVKYNEMNKSRDEYNEMNKSHYLRIFTKHICSSPLNNNAMNKIMPLLNVHYFMAR